MSTFGDKKLGPLLGRWTDLVCRHASLTVAAFLLTTVALGYYTRANLGINTDTTDMISDDLPWRQTLIDFRDNFPQLFGTLVVVIDGDSVDLAEDAAEKLASALEQESAFTQVHQPGGGEFFRRHGLLFLDTEDLETLSDNLADAQPFLSKISRSPDVTTLFSLLSDAVTMGGSAIELEQLFERLAESLEPDNQGRFRQLSWAELMAGGDANAQDRRRFIVASPQLEFSQWLAARDAIATVRRLSADLGLHHHSGVRVRLTGNVALEHEELKSVSRGAGLAGALALVMVTLILFTALRSGRLVLACILTLIGGLVATAAFAAAAIGHLNLISIAFAVLYIGLGIDFAIHYVLRYRELLQHGRAQRQAVIGAAQDVGASLVLCAATTSLGFYAFFPTAFAGVSELGLISGTGMFIGLAYTISLLPALLTLMPLDVSRLPRKTLQPGRVSLLGFPVRHSRLVLIAAVIVSVGCAAAVPFVEFDSNPLNLRDPTTESVQTYRELLADEGESPLTLSVLVADGRVAASLAEELARLDVASRTLHLGSFVPREQDHKLAMLQDLRFILGPDLYAPKETQPAAGPGDRLAAIRDFRSSLEAYVTDSPPENATSRALLARLESLETRLAELEPSARQATLDELDRALLGTLPGRLSRLREALGASRVDEQDLPESVTSRWRATDGRYRVEVFPAADISSRKHAEDFVGGVQEIAPAATGIPVIQLGAGRAVVQAFQQAFASALLLISALLFILLRSLRDTLLIVAPLLLVAGLTAAAAVAFGIHFNFANIITLPLLLGVGVDSGIHMVHRARSAPPSDGNLLRTSTARAIFFSGLTTTASFGNLAFSKHLGTASMGQLLTLGMLFTLLCTLVLLPALLKQTERGHS